MKIALLGDIALYGKFSTTNKLVFEYFKNVRDYLQKYDYVIGNLETPFSINAKPHGYKSAYISAKKEDVEILKYLGVNVVNLANNHICDFGLESFNQTKKILNDNEIDYFGIGGKKIRLVKNENRISLNGFCCYSTNPIDLGKNKINELNYKRVKASLIHDNEHKYNSILSMHAGQEHVNYPNYDHLKFARKLSEISSYVYYGHHPHVLQGIEVLNNSLLAYSLGNFCFDDLYTSKSDKPLVKQTTNNKRSIILSLEYNSNKLIKHEIIPIYSGKTGIEIGNSQISKDINLFSQKLKFEEFEYNKMRNKLIIEIHRKRKSNRTLRWYFVRLNLRTIMIIKDLILNKIKYHFEFKKYL